jgi:hypothetical protein
MGQFRFKKIYVNFDINGHHHRLEHDDDLLMKWSKMSNDYQQMAEQIEADPDGNSEDQIKLFKDFFKNEFYDGLFGRGAYDEDFDGLRLSAYDLMELFVYMATEIQAVESSRFAQWSGGNAPVSNIDDYKRSNRPKSTPAKKRRKN